MNTRRYWERPSRPKRPTRPASTPERVFEMTDTERRYKAAFMALLEDYQNDVCEYDSYDYCYNCCPSRSEFYNGCPGHTLSEEDGFVTSDFDFDKCREAIFKWYVEKANG